ncbi:type IV conjugative transfer system protein TraE [Piscinibacter koreensis]|jgi:conjugal transfer pilus assembly protein TraE|uniref:Type IV conjugative transfer system protein TraE n=1 Tax=Piscinibacter koreensis TaxID=2742824 RepID=A0A7Y6NSJ7_9BURK|nr:type IV conjugative transfer system protein TraE [Schlegelella koreensis]NUZ08551.1 type IV conjugative transfer system protein TraE [Schlegelella koreensis]
MDFAQHQNDLRAQRRANRVLSAIVAALSMTVLLCLIVIVSIVGSDRTVIVPPNIDRTFWVTKEKASREYLEEMASYVAWLVLDVTPSTVDWKKNVLLNWVAPDQHAAMKTKMDLEAERLRGNNATTFFLVQQLAADEAKQSVVVTGRLRRQINGADVTEPETRSYLAQFQYAGGRVHIQSFKEIPYAQPGQQTRVGAADPNGAPAR